MTAIQQTEVLIIGAGAAGLMCAIEAGKRGRQVVVLDHANRPGKKILMSGGGRCNFTNYFVEPTKFISHNPHFCKSALKRYTQWDFIELVKKHRILFHEKAHGQLFCDHKSKEIVDLLLTECQMARVKLSLETSIHRILQLENLHFQVDTTQGTFLCESLVVATGGLSIPTLGASPLGYKIAEQFGLKVWPTRAALVPFTLHVQDKERFSPLSGISADSLVQTARQQFRENILFTHRGLSGPAILQISSYWEPGETVTINMLPEIDLVELLRIAQKELPKKQLASFLSEHLPKRVVDVFVEQQLGQKKLAELSRNQFQNIVDQLQHWALKPNATEGYRTAEVTLGGVDCEAISSKTMECLQVKNLYFIGEVLDVTGWLGGYNFQWAWSSGWAAGQVV